MDIRLCHNEKQWNASREFLQTWGWGKFQRAVGREPIRLQAVEHGNIMGQWQGFVHRLPLGMTYGYFPKISDQRSAISDQMIEYLFKKYSFVFLRLEPVDTVTFKSPISNLQSPISNLQPHTTLLLDISPPEEQILSAMHEKTRYNIRLAEKKGVVVEQKKDTDIFWRLNQETTQRDG
ncbi:MAG: peptidoglycan bridge formation glycyltransferase FemA/FemB family protein, partial [Patescibacteria group bacterium]